MFFRKEIGIIYMLVNLKIKLFIDIFFMVVVCICKIKNGELLIGLVKYLKYFVIG